MAPPADANASPPFTPRKRVLVVADLINYTRLAKKLDNLETAAFIDEYYRLCYQLIAPAGGRIVKFLGDACLAVFPPERCLEAVDAVAELSRKVGELGSSRQLPFPIRLGANVHMSVIIEGEFGPAETAHYDVLGEGVNFTFLLGRGEGIRISEPVYRKLPSERRSPWERVKPPTRYVLGGCER